MGFKIVFTKPATTDLSGLVSYISRDNPQAAERFSYAITPRLLLEWLFLRRRERASKNLMGKNSVQWTETIATSYPGP
jgi:hypothetical protein